jgi:hemoglobin
MVSLFQRAGGESAIDRLVEAFYVQMDTLPEAQRIRAMHARDLEATKETLKRYFSEWMGGPKLYSPEKGHPRLRQRHIRFTIDVAERDSWLSCMRAALDQAIADPEARSEIYSALVKLADWMRNQPGNPHDAKSHQH